MVDLFPPFPQITCFPDQLGESSLSADTVVCTFFPIFALHILVQVFVAKVTLFFPWLGLFYHGQTHSLDKARVFDFVQSCCDFGSLLSVLWSP